MPPKRSRALRRSASAVGRQVNDGAAESQGSSGAAKPPPKRARSAAFAGAIGKIVEKVKKSTVSKSKKDETIKRFEDSIRERFIDDAEYFDKDNVVAFLIGEHRGSFKRMDLELTAQHTLATNNLHRLVFQHSTDFLELFRDIRKSQSVVDDLKKDFHEMKCIIGSLSRLSFSHESNGESGTTSHRSTGIIPGATGGAIKATSRRRHASLLSDSAGTSDEQQNIALAFLHRIPDGSLRSADKLVTLPFAGGSAKAPPTAVSLDDGRVIHDQLGDVSQKITDGQLVLAGETLSLLNSQATDAGLLPGVLELEQTLSGAAVEQLNKLPMTFAYFDVLQLPLLRLLVQLGRSTIALDMYLALHARWIRAELHGLKDTADATDFAVIATDMIVSMIEYTLKGLHKLGIVMIASSVAASVRGGGQPKSRRAREVPSTATGALSTSASSGAAGALPHVAANSRVVLWVQQQIESFGSEILRPLMLSMHNINAGTSAPRICSAAIILTEAMARLRALDGVGVPHSDLHLVRVLESAIRVILRDFARRTTKKVASTNQTLMHSVKLAVRMAAEEPLRISREQSAALAQTARHALEEVADGNRKCAGRLSHFSPSSHLTLLTLLINPGTSPLFQSPVCGKKLSDEWLAETLRQGLGTDPYVWSSRTTRAVLTDLLVAAQAQNRVAGGTASLIAEAIHFLEDGTIYAMPRVHRLAVVRTVSSGGGRCSLLNPEKVQTRLNRLTEERLAALQAASGGANTAAVVTPATLNNLLIRSDIATPFWSRVVRDVFAQALQDRSNQIQASLNTLLQILRSHAGTNPVTLMHRKVVMNVLRNHRFIDADVAEDSLERMDAQHFAWMFSPACELSYWSRPLPRLYLADMFEARSPSTYADVIKILRSGEGTVIDAHVRLAITQELQPLVEAVAVAEETMTAQEDPMVPLEKLKGSLSASGIVSSQWTRKIRVLLARSLEKKYASRDSFSKIAEVARFLRDPLPLRLSLDHRKLAAVQLLAKADEFISAAVAELYDCASNSLELEENCAAALVSPDHLTHLLNRADIGSSYWSRATMDALADALERAQQKSGGTAHAPLIALLRNTQATSGLSASQRREVREALKRKVETECSSATKEIAVQSALRITPQYVQRVVLSASTSDASRAPSAGGTALVEDIWCDAIRLTVSTALKTIVDHWQDLVERLRGPLRVAISKEARLELNKLLSGYAFSQNDINLAQQQALSATSAAKGGTSAVLKKLSEKAILSAEDFSFVLGRHAGPSQAFQFAVNSFISLLTSIRGGTLLPGEHAATTTAVTVGVPTLGDEVGLTKRTLLQTPLIAEQVDHAMAAAATGAADSTATEISNLLKIIQSPVLQEGFASSEKRPTDSALSVDRLMPYALRRAPCSFVFQALFASLIDLVSLSVLVDFACSPHGVAQLLGEDVVLQLPEVHNAGRTKLTPLVEQQIFLALIAGWTGASVTSFFPDGAASGIERFTQHFLLAQYVGSSVPLSEVTTPTRLTGLIAPLDGYCSWRLATTIPSYPRFDFDDVDVSDEAFLFHYAVQICCNLMLLFQDVFLGEEFDAVGSSVSESNDGRGFLDELRPQDGSAMQHWVIGKRYASNFVVSVALLQAAVLAVVGDLCHNPDGCLQKMFGEGLATGDPAVAKALVNFFAVLYYFWAPLFTSSYGSSLLAQGYLSGETSANTAADPAQAARSSKKSGGSPATDVAAQKRKADVPTCEVSVQHVDAGKPSKVTLLRCTSTAPTLEDSRDRGDALAILILSLFEEEHSGLRPYASALFSDITKRKAGKLFGSVNLLDFSGQRSVADAAQGATETHVCLAHVHELLVHYLRPLS